MEKFPLRYTNLTNILEGENLKKTRVIFVIIGATVYLTKLLLLLITLPIMFFTHEVISDDTNDNENNGNSNATYAVEILLIVISTVHVGIVIGWVISCYNLSQYYYYYFCYCSGLSVDSKKTHLTHFISVVFNGIENEYSSIKQSIIVRKSLSKYLNRDIANIITFYVENIVLPNEIPMTQRKYKFEIVGSGSAGGKPHKKYRSVQVS